MPRGQNKDQAVVIEFGGSETITRTGINSSYLETFFKLLHPELEALFMRAILVIDGGLRGEIAQKEHEEYLKRKNPPLAQWWIDQMKQKIYQEYSLDHAAQLAKLTYDLGMNTTPELAESKNEAWQLLRDRSFLTVLGLFEAGQTADEATMYAAGQLLKQGYQASVVILSNYTQLFTANPHEDEDAQPIKKAQAQHLLELRLHQVEHQGLQLTPEAVQMLERISRRNKLQLYYGSSDYINARNVKSFLRDEDVSLGTVINNKTTNLELY